MVKTAEPQEAIAMHLYTTLSNDAKNLLDHLKALKKRKEEIISKCNAIKASLTEKESSTSNRIRERLTALNEPMNKLIKEMTDIARESKIEASSRQYHEVYY